MKTNKPHVIKDFNRLKSKLQEQIKLLYPYGFSENLISFNNKDGILISALPFETDEIFYLLRMTAKEADKIIAMDKDYSKDGKLKEAIKNEYEIKYADLDQFADIVPADKDED